jgi:hypothetical protein
VQQWKEEKESCVLRELSVVDVSSSLCRAIDTFLLSLSLARLYKEQRERRSRKRAPEEKVEITPSSSPLDPIIARTAPLACGCKRTALPPAFPASRSFRISAAVLEWRSSTVWYSREAGGRGEASVARVRLRRGEIERVESLASGRAALKNDMVEKEQEKQKRSRKRWSSIARCSRSCAWGGVDVLMLASSSSLNLVDVQ